MFIQVILIAFIISSVCIAALARYSNAPRIGVAAHFMWHGLDKAQAELDWIKRAGFTVARFDVNWEELEPNQKAQWNIEYLTKLDHVLRLMGERNIQPIIVFLETPAWARNYTGTKMTPPNDPADFGDAIGYLAGRYAGRWHMVYEVWNEPNESRFWETGENPDAVFYTRMLQAAYTKVKLADPYATVLGGSLLFRDLKYLEQMYAAGARGYFDALAVHPYNNDHEPDWVEPGKHHYSFAIGVPQLKKLMEQQGEPNKPIWITEMGWSDRKVQDATRALYYRRAVELVKQWSYVKVFCAYTANQADNAEYGLVAADGTPTKSWAAFSKSASSYFHLP